MYRAVTSRHRRRVRGFSLIELMIVVTIVAILTAIAYPSYQSHLRKARRADGRSMLLETAQRLERCFTRYNSYTHASCDVDGQLEGGGVLSAEEWYLITNTNRAATGYTLSADGQDVQAADPECSNMTVTHTGARAPADCW